METQRQAAAVNSPMFLRVITIILIVTSTVQLLAIPDLRWFGWAQLGVATTLATSQYKKRFDQYLLIIIAMVALLGVSPISTDLSTSHFLLLGGAMTLTLVIPYSIVNKVLHAEKVITFPFHTGREWARKEIAYIAVAVSFTYFVVPYYFGVSGSYQNWDVSLTADSILRLFLGTHFKSLELI